MITWQRISFVLVRLINSFLENQKLRWHKSLLPETLLQGKENSFIHEHAVLGPHGRRNRECSSLIRCLDLCVTVPLACHRYQCCSMLPLTGLLSILRADCVPISFWKQKDQWHPINIPREPKLISVFSFSCWILFGSWREGLYHVPQVIEKNDPFTMKPCSLQASSTKVI